MSHLDFKDGWGIVDNDGLNVKTISETRRAAIVNWLVVEAKILINFLHSDQHIDALWDSHRGEALVKPVKMYVHD